MGPRKNATTSSIQMRGSTKCPPGFAVRSNVPPPGTAGRWPVNTRLPLQETGAPLTTERFRRRDSTASRDPSGKLLVDRLELSHHPSGVEFGLKPRDRSIPHLVPLATIREEHQ